MNGISLVAKIEKGEASMAKSFVEAWLLATLGDAPEGAGAPKLSSFVSERSAVAAASRLSLAMDYPVSAADYLEAVEVLFSGMVSEGWVFSHPSNVRIQQKDAEVSQPYIRSIPLEALKRR